MHLFTHVWGHKLTVSATLCVCVMFFYSYCLIKVMWIEGLTCSELFIPAAAWHLHWPRVWKRIHPPNTHTDLHVCMHTQSATSHCCAELYSRSSYKYLYLSRLIFISSSRAHIRGAAGWWGYPETERRERRGEEGRGGGEKWSDEGGRDRKLDRMLNSEIPLQIRSLVKRKGGDISSVWMNIWKKLEEWINEENNKKKQLHWLKLAKC